jgi:hypothetical protein
VSPAGARKGIALTLLDAGARLLQDAAPLRGFDVYVVASLIGVEHIVSDWLPSGRTRPPTRTRSTVWTCCGTGFEGTTPVPGVVDAGAAEG